MKTFGSPLAIRPLWVAFASSEPGMLAAAGVAFTAETPCNAARAAPRDRMVGSFFAMPHLPKIRFDSNLGCEDTTNQLRHPGQYLASGPVFGRKWDKTID
jgi:hypothetical protein